MSKATELNFRNSIPKIFFFQLQSTYADPSKLKGNVNPVLIENKWIYIFRNNGKSANLVYELKTVIQDGVQEFEHVLWDKEHAQANRTTFPRKTDTVRLQKLELQLDEEYFIILSREQLPMHRIVFYTENQQLVTMIFLSIYAKEIVSAFF